MEPKPAFLPQQPLVILVALLFWALAGYATWLAAVICYLLALGVVNLVLVWFPSALLLAPNSTALRRFWVTLAWLAIAAAAGPMILGLDAKKQWSTLRENLADRLAIENLPAISPPLLVSYEPQRFTIFAPGCKSVSVRWTPASKEISAIDLGNGVFWLDFDPRINRALEKVTGADLTCEIIADGSTHRRQLNFVRAQPHPRQVRSAPAAGIAATVSEETDEVILIRRDGSHQRIGVGDGPTDCALIAEGQKIVVAHRFTPEIWIVAASTGEVTQRIAATPQQTRLAVSPDQKWLAVAQQGPQRGVRFHSLPELKSSTFLPLEWSPDWLEFAGTSDSAPQLIVTDRRGRTVRRIVRQDEAWALQEPALHFPRPITALGKTPDAGQLALATTASHLTADQLHANHFIENTIHILDVAAWQIAATHITDRRGLRQDSPGDTEHGVSPLAIAVIDGRLYAACTGSNEIAEVTSHGVATTWLSLDSFPLFGPQGLADLGDGVWCVASPSEGNIGLFDRTGALQTVIELAPNEIGLASQDAVALDRRRGERTFIEGTRAGIACQSCHLDAETDFCQHDIGQRKAVDVLSVRGIMGTSPYLRDASHWRLQDLHEVAAVGYRDYIRPVPWDRAAALAKYLNSLPPAPHPLASDKLDVTRLKSGVAAFFQADCATCHTPPAFTNLGQHSATSLFPDYYGPQGAAPGTDAFLDTPSLRGVALTPPYLHNARAPTLRAVLTEWNQGQRHGNTRQLSVAQLADLLYFLERL